MATFKELRESRKGHTLWYLTTIEYIGTRRNLYSFSCKCGNEVVASWQRVVKGDVKSCGCWRKGRPVSSDPYVPHRAVYHQYRLSAKRRNIEFDLTEQQVIELIIKDCFYCGSPPSNNIKLSAHPDFRYNGIDRMFNDEGYHAANVVPCCVVCNRAKLDMNYQDWHSWLGRIKGAQHDRTCKQEAE